MKVSKTKNITSKSDKLLRLGNLELKLFWALSRFVSRFLSRGFHPKKQAAISILFLQYHTQNWPSNIWSNRCSVQNSRRNVPVAGLFWQPCTPNGTNLSHDELHNFPAGFGVGFAASFQGSRFDWQLRTITGISNKLRNVCQKLCEMHCKNKLRI